MSSGLKLQIYQGWSAVITPLSLFWHWWCRELAELIPANWRQRLRGRERTIRFSGGVLEVNEGNKRIAIPLEQAAGHPLFTTWRTLGSKSALLVTVPPGELLCKVISLPAATEPRMSSVLGYELDRHTPFSSAQAGYGYRILHRDRATAKIDVELFVLPDSKRRPLLQALNDAGLKPDYLLPEGLEEDRRTLNLLDSDQVTTLATPRIRFPAILLLALVALVAFAFYQRDRQIAALEAEVAVQEPLAEQARQLKSEIGSLQAGGEYIRQMKSTHPSTLILLDEMTRLLPDSTWLNRLELDGNEIRIQGESSSASELIGLLEQSELFGQAEFSAPVTINPRTRKERFALTLSVAQEGAP
ncbi:PilN domain-containing protein [Marinobacterium sp. D7]|uniref:PilN domain-containing protein n=1 Tax=Marinobacterium ramblicola TaxID=2849041 RepID=UPI001C2D2CA4|nr:PilN domain-containing protein [Marinobacterium ramblicola]MBV1787976.1 PilN domain-containing protein [Marinobacterium ramblicola]